MNDGDTLCVCGHRLDEHHVSWFAMTGDRIVEECEAIDDWEHCLHFRKETSD